jgi:hypothetical protein
MNLFKTITLYDAERNKNKGNGYYTVNIKVTDKLQDDIKRIREDQKKKNIEFKQKKVEEIPKLIIEKETNIEIEPKTDFKLMLDENTGNTTLILGSSKMGKSTLLMKIYDDYYSDKNIVSILWAGNPHIKVYEKHKNLIVASVWDNKSVEIIESQKKIQVGTKNKYEFCNMFDDVIDVRNSDLVRNLMLSYRNSKISSLISLQYPNLLAKSSRANCNNVICFKFVSDECIEVVIKMFFKGYLSSIGIKKMGDQINWYKKMTDNHSFIYLKPADNIISFHKLNI